MVSLNHNHSGPVTNSQGGTNEQTTDASKSSENANVKEQVNASVNGGNVESRETTDTLKKRFFVQE